MALMVPNTLALALSHTNYDITAERGQTRTHALTDEMLCPLINNTPREVRDLIYGFVIAEQVQTVHLNKNSHNVLCCDHPLLLVSRQIHNEFLDQLSAKPIPTLVKVDSFNFDNIMKALKKGEVRSPGFIARYATATPKARLHCKLSFNSSDFDPLQLGKWVAFIKRHGLRTHYNFADDQRPTEYEYLPQIFALHDSANRDGDIEVVIITAPIQLWQIDVFEMACPGFYGDEYDKLRKLAAQGT